MPRVRAATIDDVARGASRLDAMVNADNAGAVAFWQSTGFELDEEDRRWSLLL